jgi:hypothetical protein
MGKKSTPPPPDYSDLVKMSEEIGKENAQVAREQLAWAREQDANNRATLERVLGVQLPIMEEQFKNAQEDRARYEQTYLPIEQNLINEFQNYGTPERMQQERGRAIADVSAGFDAQRRNALQRLESYGIDPSQTRSQALDVGVRTAQAAAQAAAADAATQRVENTGRALRAEAINIGRGLPSQVAQSYGQSIGAGQAGIGGANQTTSTSAGALTSGLGFTQAGLSGLNQAGSLMNQGFQNRMDIANYNQATSGMWMDMAGSVAGSAMGFMQEGGVVPERGALPVPPVPGTTDRQPAAIAGPGGGGVMLTPGEGIVPKDVVEWKGQEFFEKLKSKSREDRMQAEIEKRRAQPQQAIPQQAAAAIPMRG